MLQTSFEVGSMKPPAWILNILENLNLIVPHARMVL